MCANLILYADQKYALIKKKPRKMYLQNQTLFRFRRNPGRSPPPTIAPLAYNYENNANWKTIFTIYRELDSNENTILAERTI